jgi:hypothetical protein
MYLLARYFFSTLNSKLLQRFPQQTQENGANRVPGILPEFVNGLLNAAIVSALLLSLPFFDGLSAVITLRYGFLRFNISCTMV